MGKRWKQEGRHITSLEEPDSHHVLELLSDEDEYGDLEAWCARLSGVDPEHGWLRVFLSPGSREACGASRWRLDFELSRPGYYECRERSSSPPLYMEFEHDTLTVLSEAQTRERVLAGSRATRAEVDVACQHHLWEDAERIARNLPDAADRGEALLAIHRQRSARDDTGLMRLLGTPRQRQWASLVRERALVRLNEIKDEARGDESAMLPGVSITAAHLTLAMDRVRCEQRATFWIAMRDALAIQHPARFIEALVIGEHLHVIESPEQ